MHDETDDVESTPDSPGEELEAGELTRETKPPQKPEPPEPGKEESPQVNRVIITKENLEEIYPGITEQIRLFVEENLPPCPYCASQDTASVQVGMTGRAAVIAENTTKVKLIPNAKDKLGTYFCNVCGKYFN
jgi:hypothetical protein